MTKKTKPAQTYAIGPVRAAIWENESQNGPFFNVTFSRSYKSGDSFKNSESFRSQDLLALSRLADQAHSWILNQ